MKHNPRLDTIIRVETILKQTKEPLSINEINNRSNKKIMRSTINTILNYLEKSEKIIRTEKGSIWKIKNEIEINDYKETINHETQKETIKPKENNIYNLLEELEQSSEELEEANKTLKEL